MELTEYADCGQWKKFKSLSLEELKEWLDKQENHDKVESQQGCVIWPLRSK